MKIIYCTLTLFGALATCGNALADAHLQAAVPAQGAIITAPPSALSLSFSEGLELKLSGATLKGSDGQPIATGMASLSPTDDKMMSIPVSGPLAAGAYTVDWHAFSNDGHATHGSYQFTVDR